MSDPWDQKPDTRDRENGKSRGGHGDLTDVLNVWIGGLPNDITEREVEKLFSQFGQISHITVKTSSNDTYAFINFSENGCAKAAIRKFDQSRPFGAGVVKCAAATAKRNAGTGGKGAGKSDWGRSDGRRSRSPQRTRDRSRSPQRARDRSRSPQRARERSRSPQRARDRSRSGGRDPHARDRSRSTRRDRPREEDRQDRDRDRDRDRERDRDRDRSPPPKSSTRNFRVYLSQLPRDMEKDELQELANDHGKLLKFDLHREGAYKCGWIEYANKREADRAVRELDDRRMADWTMRLQAYIYPGGVA